MITWGESQDGDDFCLATWHCYFHAELHFVYNKDGKPALDFHPVSSLHDAYRWNSYHAARKFQRKYPQLAGYMVCNLSAIRRQCQAERERKNAPTQH